MKNQMSTIKESYFQRQRTRGLEKNIIPNQMYVLEPEPGTSGRPILTGEQVIARYEENQRRTDISAHDYMKGTSEFITTVKGLPSGTTFTPAYEEQVVGKEKTIVQTGYQINIPESVKLEQAKTAIKQYEGLPPGIKEITLAGYYLESNLLSMGKPVADVLGKTKEYNIATSIVLAQGGALPGTKGYYKNVGELIVTTKYDVHYPSAWDIAFEPLGMSPKGSVDILRKHPVEAAVGNIGAEAASWIVFSGVARVGTQAAGKTFEIVAPKIYSSAGRLNLEFGAKLGRFIPGALKETSVIKNIGLFTKGYRPALVMAPGRTIIGKESVAIGEDITGKIITQKTPYVLNLERKFLSPEAYAKASTDLTKQLSTRTIEIGFPNKQYIGRQGYIVSSVSKEYYQTKGFITKTLIKKGEYSIYRKPVMELGDSHWLVISDKQIGKFGSLYNVGKPSTLVPALESEMASPIQKKYLMTRGIYKPQMMASKKWIAEYREPFMKNIRGESRLVSQFEVTEKMSTWTPKTMRSQGLIIPSEYLSTKAGYKISSIGLRLGAMKWAYQQRGMQMPETRKIQTPASMKIYGGLPASMFKELNRSLQDQETRFDRWDQQISLMDQQQKQMKDFDIDVSTEKISQSLFVPFIMPGLSVQGAAGSSWGWDELFGKRKRYRMTKTFNPLEELL